MGKDTSRRLKLWSMPLITTLACAKMARLHDVVEDYNVSVSEIRLKFGGAVADAVNALSKNSDGFKKAEGDYYHIIGTNPIASVVKDADRVNNVQTMLGVFSKEKQRSYIAESKNLVLPMLKVARRKFPAQEAVYENTKHILVSQLSIISLMIDDSI